MPSLKLSNPFRRSGPRPSLKERAAALRTSAARVLKRTEPKAPPAAPREYVDPLSDDGTVTFLDAAGNVHRETVPRWVSFMAQRMYSISRRDYERRFRAYPSDELDGEGWMKVDAQLRREMGLDALKALAFNSIAVFDSVEAEHAPVDEDERRPDAALIALCNEASREERTAQIKCNTDPYPAEGEPEPDYWGRSGELLAQATAARPTTLRGLAAKAKVLLAHVPDASELAVHPTVCELAMALVRDVVRVSDGADTASTDLAALAARFDAAHTAWLAACEVHREPRERHSEYLEAAKARGGPTMEDIHAAEALPGVKETWKAEEQAFGIVGDLGLEILSLPARTFADLAAQARTLIPHVWPTGSYEADAHPDEDSDKEVIRMLIDRACAAAGVDWRGNVVSPAGAAPDPIHAAIAASRAAQAAYEAWEQGVSGWMTKADFATEDKLVAEQTRAREAAFATAPTTRAGQFALLDYARWQLDLHGQDDETGLDVEGLIWREAFQALEASVRAGVIAEAAQAWGA